MSLWQKPDGERPAGAQPSVMGATMPIHSAPVSGRSDRLVNIGQSIEIKGELTGNEDLTIDGKVEGKIVLRDHNLTIGANGRIKAEVQAKTVTVVGEVVGNIAADDKIEIATSGSVQGDLRAPRVALADGASFKGAIDMVRKSEKSAGSPGTKDMPMAAKDRAAG
jgi:cytoskeletal protein CcmA (bactofilin family)